MGQGEGSYGLDDPETPRDQFPAGVEILQIKPAVIHDSSRTASLAPPWPCPVTAWR